MSVKLRIFGLLLGVALVAWLVAHADTTTLLGVVSRIGWGFLAIVAARGATVFVDTAAWYCLIPREDRPSYLALLPLRWIGESINTTLPAGQVGGDIVRARLLDRRVSTPVHGYASSAVDFALSLFAQILFTLLGCVMLAWLGDRDGWWWAAASAVLVPIFAVFSWELLVRRRLLDAAWRLALRLDLGRIAAGLQSLGVGLGLIARGRAALALSLCLHVASFAAHTAELWLTLYLMGSDVGAPQAILLESLSLAARSAAFLIPSGWGAQEASLVALAAIAGIPAETALALGLVKRVREFTLGLPGLAAWGLAERRTPARQAG